ncbi:hypothetical protein SAMN05421879_10149 [Ornithinimicrobium cerasi]|uniref:DUF6998 domain-containing protein n=2 Tax=Ornithinimicrobium cerasi TaxID=2248773 RepID=A0A285VAM7_9MICO|nr:hypothetical protein SAMN05421879_10149 [Ornithinimicrobium cerasi]
MGSRDLLKTYAAVLTELASRGVIRSRNAPLGDVAELLVQRAYDGALAPPAAKSWDVESADGRRIQVKSRLVVSGTRRAQQYSPFRSWDFDVCVFITFDAYTYDVLQALEVPSEGVRALASPVPHVGVTAARVNTRTALAAAPGAVDVTQKIHAAMNNLV